MQSSAGGCGSSPAPVARYIPSSCVLECVVEQLVTVLPEKPEQRPHPRQPLHQHLLLR